VRIPKPFAIGRYPITYADYDRFATVEKRELPQDQGWGRDRRPVINVSWEDAVAYTKWLSVQTNKTYRLPSEAEWEYAARSGGKDETWAGTSREQELGEFAWHLENSGRQTHEVGKKRGNSLRLHDMSGNVWEWVEDCWHENYTGAPTDARAWRDETGGQCGQRVIRGGSWVSAPGLLRSWFRIALRAVDGVNYIGFRVAQDIE
jgi:formylglycine-generating enzyme required for sulfatase activity